MKRNPLRSIDRTTWIRILIGVILLLLDGAGILLFQHAGDTIYPYYRPVSKLWIRILAWLTSFTGLAVWDIAAVVLVLLIIIGAVRYIRSISSLVRGFSVVFLGSSIIVFVVVWGWMMNHYAPDLSSELGYDVHDTSEAELYEAAEYYLLKAAEYAPLMERDSDGHLIRQPFYELAETAGRGYQNLGNTYYVFQGPAVSVKKLSVIGEYLLYNGIIGMFMPVTGESGVPYNVPPADMPFTMSHEAAHRCGIAGEEEANFAAFLACMDQEDIRFRYSGYYSAFKYCFSSLYKTDRELALDLYNRHEEDAVMLVKLDRRDTSAIYRSYESSLQDISDRINDTYLKTFSEESGIQSYGEVTDDLLAYYRALKNQQEQ